MGGLKLGRLRRFRPRVLTLALLTVIAAMVVLANLTDEFSERGADVLAAPGQVRFSVRDPGPINANVQSLSYGWPLLWRQYILVPYGPYALPVVLGECSSSGRFAANLAMWLVLLAVSGTACEWRLRRRRRRFQWSLRTMLATIGLVAALCGWFAAARNRVDLEDHVIAAKVSPAVMKRWGPRWLDVIGAYRYNRVLVGAGVNLTVALTHGLEFDQTDFQAKRDLLMRLARLRELRYVDLLVGEGSPDLVDALSRMRQLRVLSIDRGSWSGADKRLSHDYLAAIGAMSGLEKLNLSGPPAISESLDCLSGLTNLKSLRLEVSRDAGEEVADPPLLSRLPSLPRLEHVDLYNSYVGDRGLRHLRVLPRLKKLSLIWTDVADGDAADLPGLQFDAGLAELASLEFLEEVTVAGDLASATGLESLVALKHLKKLHFLGVGLGSGRQATDELILDDGEKVTVLQVEIERCRRALEALRQANPGIVIDGDWDATDWPGERFGPAEPETTAGNASALFALGEWKKGFRVPKALWPQPDDFLH